jgi:hypothetical protein
MTIASPPGVMIVDQAEASVAFGALLEDGQLFPNQLATAGGAKKCG